MLCPLPNASPRQARINRPRLALVERAGVLSLSLRSARKIFREGGHDSLTRNSDSRRSPLDNLTAMDPL
jgi:hypothetical protein